jgi:uncharacterized protein YndB with AHSA1/START domain
MATLKITVPQASQNIEGVVTIKAPLEKVFEAYVDPMLFTQWWGRGNPLKIHHYDCRSGGSWHFTEISDHGEHGFTGSIHEIATNERIIQTFEYLGLPERGHVALERADFVAVDPQTTEIRTLSTFQSREDRDGMVSSGMEAGWRQSVEALGRLIEE